MTVQNIIVASTAVVGLMGVVVALWSRRAQASFTTARRAGQKLSTGSVTVGGLVINTSTVSARELNVANHIEVLRPNAGDMLVVQVDHPLTNVQRETIQQMIEPHMPEGVKLVVLDKYVTLKHVVSPIV